MQVEPEVLPSLAVSLLDRFGSVLAVQVLVEPVPRSMMMLRMNQTQRQLTMMVEPEPTPSMAVLVLRQHLDLEQSVPPLAGLSLRRRPHP